MSLLKAFTHDVVLFLSPLLRLVSSCCQRGKDKASLVHLARLEGASYQPQAIVSPQPSVSPQEDLYEDRNNSNQQNFDEMHGMDAEDNSIIVEKAVINAWKYGPDNKPTKVAASPSTSLFSSNSSSDESEQRKRRSLEDEKEIIKVDGKPNSLRIPVCVLCDRLISGARLSTR